MSEMHVCLVCDDAVSYKIVSAKKIFYGYVVRRECPFGHTTVEHRAYAPMMENERAQN